MSKVILNVDNDILANSLALWFESGDAIYAYYGSKQAIAAEGAIGGEDCNGHIILNIPQMNEDCIVDFDESAYGKEHEVAIELYD